MASIVRLGVPGRGSGARSYYDRYYEADASVVRDRVAADDEELHAGVGELDDEVAEVLRELGTGHRRRVILPGHSERGRRGGSERPASAHARSVTVSTSATRSSGVRCEKSSGGSSPSRNLRTGHFERARRRASRARSSGSVTPRF